MIISFECGKIIWFFDLIDSHKMCFFLKIILCWLVRPGEAMPAEEGDYPTGEEEAKRKKKKKRKTFHTILSPPSHPCTTILNIKLIVVTSSSANSMERTTRKMMITLQERRTRRGRWSYHWPTRSSSPTSPMTSWSRPSGSSPSSSLKHSILLLLPIIRHIVHFHPHLAHCHQKSFHFFILMNMKKADLDETDCIK